MVKVKLYEHEFVKTDDLEEGMVLTILDEFSPQGKYQKYQGRVKFPNGDEKILSLNTTSMRNISSKLGGDTIDWVAADIVYKGIQKCGNMQGKVFEVKE